MLNDLQSDWLRGLASELWRRYISLVPLYQINSLSHIYLTLKTADQGWMW